MKVNRPDSTCGRKASCCALLKRCTSSTKTMVRAARRARGLGPLDRLADVLHAGQHRRQHDEVAHPPHRPSAAPAWSCPRPAGPTGSSNAAAPIRRPRAAACPGPSRCGWPITSSSVRGRRRSASGTLASARRRGVRPAGDRLGVEQRLLRVHAPARLLLDHVGAGRRHEAEARRPAAPTLAAYCAELQQRALAEAVEDLHRRQLLAAKADAHRLERAVLLPRRGLHPVEAVLRRLRPPARSPCSSDAPASSAAGVAPSAAPSLRTLTWFRSTSWIQTFWPSLTISCSKGLA